MRALIISLIACFFSTLNYAQTYPKNDFRSPMDIPLLLSGNFGELRSNHFHAGLDIKTEGVEGKKVYAVADGYVSRIKVSPYGYGNALYITHPNGYTSVYGHLQKYSDKIAELVEKEQYRKESFSIQLFPPPFSLQVKKGEIVAYSGNTGGSGGPHLHFEIRDSKTEHTINPLFFGFDIKDNVNPDIYAITVYPLNDTSLVNGVSAPKRFRASGRNGIYTLLAPNTIKVHGVYGIGVEAVDRMSGTGNTYGLHNIKLLKGEEVIFEQQINEFAFHEGRYINSLIDYENYVQRRRRVQQSFVAEGNRLRIYKNVKNSGKIEVNGSDPIELKYVLSDLNGNSSELKFQLTPTKSKQLASLSAKKSETIRFFPHNQRNTFIDENLLVDLPKNVLYEDLYFEYRKEDPMPRTVSPLFWLHKPTTPLHSYINVSIKMESLPKELREKAVIISTTDGKGMYSEGGKWQGDNITVTTRSFGGYAVAIDSIKPSIRPINIYQNANMNGKWSIRVKIQDNLSGIDYFRGTIDGKWILMQYDAKYDMLTYYFDERVGPGNHTFKLVVKDGVGNQNDFEANFSR